MKEHKHKFTLIDGETINTNAGSMRGPSYIRFTIILCEICGEKKIHKTILHE